MVDMLSTLISCHATLLPLYQSESLGNKQYISTKTQWEEYWQACGRTDNHPHRAAGVLLLSDLCQNEVSPPLDSFSQLLLAMWGILKCPYLIHCINILFIFWKLLLVPRNTKHCCYFVSSFLTDNFEN